MVGEKVPRSNGRQLDMVEPTQKEEDEEQCEAEIWQQWKAQQDLVVAELTQQKVDDEQHEAEIVQYGKKLFAAGRALQVLDETDSRQQKTQTMPKLTQQDEVDEQEAARQTLQFADERHSPLDTAHDSPGPKSPTHTAASQG